MTDALTLFHSPQTRSTGVRILLHELGAPYELVDVNMTKGAQREAAFLAINPMGKVPAIRHRGAVVTEQVALFIYLPDLFPQAGLAPLVDDPQRGTYLRWLAFHAAAFEPAIVDLALKRAPAPPGMSPYGTSAAVFDALEAQLTPGPFILGTRFSAADVLWGTALAWTMGFGIVDKRPAFTRLADLVAARPATQEVNALDAELKAKHAA